MKPDGMRYDHMIQLHAAYPCEVLNLASSPEALQIARNTVHYYFVAQEGYKLMNELGLSAYVMGPRSFRPGNTYRQDEVSS